MLLVWEIEDDDFENVCVWQKIKIKENSEVMSTCGQLLKKWGWENSEACG